MRARAQVRIERQLVAAAQEDATAHRMKAERLAQENYRLRRQRGQLMAALDLRHDEAAEHAERAGEMHRLKVQLADARQKNGLLEREVRWYRGGWSEGRPFEEMPPLAASEVLSTHPVPDDPVARVQALTELTGTSADDLRAAAMAVPPPADEGRADPWLVTAAAELVVVVAALVLNSQPLAWVGLGLVVVTCVLAAVGTWKDRGREA